MKIYQIFIKYLSNIYLIFVEFVCSKKIFLDKKLKKNKKIKN